MTDSKAWWAKCENIIREGCVPVGETRWERVFLARDYDASEARVKELKDNRDGWMRSCGDWKERALAAEADRYRLAATVERVRALDRCGLPNEPRPDLGENEECICTPVPQEWESEEQLAEAIATEWNKEEFCGEPEISFSVAAARIALAGPGGKP